MTNRFPLIVDSSGVAALKEIPSGDNLDLTGNGIVGAGTVAITNLTVGGAQGSDGQVLTSTGSGIAWEDAAGGGVWNVINDTTISSAASSVAFTSGLSGYRVYKILITDVYFSGHFNAIELQVSSDGGSSYQTTNWQSIMTHTDDTLSGLSQTNDRDTVSGRLPVIRSAHQYNTDQRVFGEITIWNLNNSHWTYVHSRILNNYFSSRLTYTETHAQLRTTTAFNAFKFTNFYGEQNFTGGHITVYGVGD